jgi:hypothetical protein
LVIFTSENVQRLLKVKLLIMAISVAKTAAHAEISEKILTGVFLVKENTEAIPPAIPLLEKSSSVIALTGFYLLFQELLPTKKLQPFLSN